MVNDVELEDDVFVGLDIFGQRGDAYQVCALDSGGRTGGRSRWRRHVAEKRNCVWEKERQIAACTGSCPAAAFALFGC